MQLITVNGRKNKDGSVTITKENGEHFVTFANYLSNRPDYRNKVVTINCWPWRINWIKD